ncbi:MAG: hypothetical protein RIS64_195 [Bacteroidota bacterium]|jgi:Peptidase family S41/Tricorn protease C1 domain
MQLFKLTILLLLLMLITSCSRVLMPSNPQNTATKCFDLMWQTIDEKYSFFEYKRIDWDSIRRKYRPRVHDTMPQEALFQVLSQMLYELRDGHVNLTTPFDRSRNWSWRDEYFDNFNQNFVYRHYLKQNFRLTNALPNQIIDSIGYVRYGSFGAPISESDLDYVFERFRPLKGMIIDVRDNGGGSMINIFKWMGRFVKYRTLVGYGWVKNGKGHQDFDKKIEFYAEPRKGVVPFTKPVVILTNRGCYSATNFFAGFMSLLSNVTLIGDQTGGGGGLPISADLPNGWQYRFSGTYATLPDGFNIEFGVPPKIQVSTGAKEELEGKDAIIERALQEIRNSR